MRAMLTDENRNFVWTQVENPVIRPDEVLVEVHAAALNRADLMQRNGEYPSPEGCPPWMGLEIAGIIAQVGPEAERLSSWRVGDAVCALLGGGGYSEQCAVKYDMLMPVPKGFSMVEAAAIPETYATAYLNLFMEAQLKKGETFLVQAGASGVGIAATQIAHAFGARVIATVRSDEKAEAIRGFGADYIYNTKKTDIVRVFEEHPVDVVLDCVCGEKLGPCLAKMNRYGRWISIAILGGASTQIDMHSVVFQGKKLIGSTLRSRTPAMKARVLRELVDQVFPFFESGAMRPVIYAVYPMSDVEKAHRVLEENRNVGKVVLTLR